MALANRMQQQELIVVKIEQVDLDNRIAHVRDKTNSPLMVSFRESPGGLFHVPAQDEKWTAKRIGATWHLEHKLDTLDDHLWVTANMQPGDTRVSSDGTLHILSSETILVNDRPFGATVRDFFYSPSVGFTAVTLTGTPVSVGTVQPFLNGLLCSPHTYTISDATLTFLQTMGAGELTVYYQTLLHEMDDAATVVGRAVISAVESYT